MKKLLAIMLVFVMIPGLAACGGTRILIRVKYRTGSCQRESRKIIKTNN